MDQRHIERKGRQRDRYGHREDVQAQTTGGHQQQRPDQVKLFLDAERPQMQQRLLAGFDVEIAGLRQLRKIRKKRRAGDDVGAQLRIGHGQHP